ncbi:glutathione S-transferase [Burkholderiales bacterium JOSHI_001]|nr:glutathione S-transferase [Burkholderiales bacterium JOSHI_001]
MTTDRRVTFFHAPHTRSHGVRILMEELQADHELQVLDMKTGQQRQAAYLAINPMGKVPAIRHGDTVVTEQAAVYMYLAELYPERGLSPAVGDALRGPYLRWMVYYGSCFEPAMVDRAMKREPAPPSTSPYGDAATVVRQVHAQLEAGPWWLGERFSAADVLWASALGWMTQFKLVPETPALMAYLARFQARPAVQRAKELDEALVAQLETQRAG